MSTALVPNSHRVRAGTRRERRSCDSRHARSPRLSPRRSAPGSPRTVPASTHGRRHTLFRTAADSSRRAVSRAVSPCPPNRPRRPVEEQLQPRWSQRLYRRPTAAGATSRTPGMRVGFPHRTSPAHASTPQCNPVPD
jgi:hypothetical protein